MDKEPSTSGAPPAPPIPHHSPLSIRQKLAAVSFGLYGVFCVIAVLDDFRTGGDPVPVVAGVASGLVFLFCASGMFLSRKVQDPAGPMIRLFLCMIGMFLALALIGKVLVQAPDLGLSQISALAGAVLVLLFAYSAAAQKGPTI